MTINKDTKILIIGLGVIGGSYATALKRQGYRVKCITKDKKDIEYALEKRIIDYGTTDTDPGLIAEAELIIFALYPTIFVDWIEKNASLISPGTLITDVTGVKSSVVERVQSMLPDSIEFISAHPMAGRERSGVEYSDPEVFKGANYIVTPTAKNTREAIDTCKSLGQILGFARISELSVKEHDEMIAFLSQLTHVIAVSLMTCNSTEGLEKYTGDSFRDLTRIAKINDAMWSELFLMNKDALLSQMDDFIDEMQRFRRMISEGKREQMRELMRRSTARRSLFDKPKA
ncbi:MAG: prephenate dehydrogenase [Clostridia bacterium]|nr:prephenate dehydrogenase [Clostridia bacterium]